MLSFAREYREAVDALTSDRSMELRGLELGNSEWKIVTQLCDILKVCHICHYCYILLTRRTESDILGRDSLLLSRYTQPRHGHSGHGLVGSVSDGLLTEPRYSPSHSRCCQPRKEDSQLVLWAD